MNVATVLLPLPWIVGGKCDSYPRLRKVTEGDFHETPLRGAPNKKRALSQSESREKADVAVCKAGGR